MTATDVELFGRNLPLAASAAVRRPCVACRLTYRRPLAAEHHLCPECAADLDATRARVIEAMVGIESRLTANEHARHEGENAIPDDLIDRYLAMRDTWELANGALSEARTARYASQVPDAVRAAAVTAARERLEAIEAKIARTEAQVPALAPHIAAWRGYQREQRRLQDERTQWETALNHIDVAAGALPF